ncbi:MAG: DMT family transporter [Clostridia bacterium]|jgi:drug/metabolite transporter (DMT)-like permease
MSQSTDAPPAGNLKYEALLFIVAAIWGSGFVAQRMGMDDLGPFAFNGARFAIGSLALVPVILLRRTSVAAAQAALRPAILAGFVLTAAAGLQQIGMQYTGAGKAGFITGLYVVFVPVAACFLGKKTPGRTWLGAVLALAGLFLLSVSDTLSMENGDFIIFISAFFWSAHILVLDRWAPEVDPIVLASIQFAVCSIFSWSIAIPVETFSVTDFHNAAVPLLFGGLVSTGIAFTLQAIAQTKAHPARASIILSLEAAFAVLAGWLILGEALSLRELAGCVLMLTGIIITQLPGSLDPVRQKPLQ